MKHETTASQSTYSTFFKRVLPPPLCCKHSATCDTCYLSFCQPTKHVSLTSSKNEETECTVAVSHNERPQEWGSKPVLRGSRAQVLFSITMLLHKDRKRKTQTHGTVLAWLSGPSPSPTHTDSGWPRRAPEGLCPFYTGRTLTTRLPLPFPSHPSGNFQHDKGSRGGGAGIKSLEF